MHEKKKHFLQKKITTFKDVETQILILNIREKHQNY